MSSILRRRLKPIIFLVNNDGYTIDRLILGQKRSNNDIQPWRYAELGKVFAGNTAFTSFRVATQSELESALQHAEHSDSGCFIEVVMERLDAPASLRRLGPVYAQQDYGSGYVIPHFATSGVTRDIENVGRESEFGIVEPVTKS